MSPRVCAGADYNNDVFTSATKEGGASSEEEEVQQLVRSVSDVLAGPRIWLMVLVIAVLLAWVRQHVMAGP